MFSSDIDLQYLRQVLGENSFRRLLAFCEYGPGWNGQASRPINESSVRFLQEYFRKHYGQDYKAPEYFLDIASERDKALSLFMTSEGYMTLNWLESKTRAIIELTFFEDGKTIEYFYGGTDNTEELSADLVQIPKYPARAPSEYNNVPHLNFTPVFSKTDYEHWARYWNKQNAK